jgi:hypothetical protein
LPRIVCWTAERPTALLKDSGAQQEMIVRFLFVAIVSFPNRTL